MRPAAASCFEAKKARILQQLQRPAGEYADASPKGSVDTRIRPLIDTVNRADGFVTTSSCAGRVSVFVDSPGPASCDDGDRRRAAGVSGKGSGGGWLLVSHDLVAARCCHGQSWLQALGYAGPAAGAHEAVPLPRERRLIHFKFEPMILHVLTASPVHAQLILRCALQAGFRESGAINLADPAGPPSRAPPASSAAPTPMVAICSAGLGLESLIGYECDDTPRRRWLVSAAYLETLRTVANERFADNAGRNARFQAAFLDAVAPPRPTVDPGGLAGVWEDAATRKARMRADGLRRQAALAAEKEEEAARAGA